MCSLLYLFLPTEGVPRLPILETRRQSLITRSCPQPLSFHTLAHFLARRKTQLFSPLSHSLPKTPGVAVAREERTRGPKRDLA